ncbi:hypothetical protein ACFFHJ_05770 [Planotetraspora thailandica]|nr:hypothetical protein [Planotetraspora thailandica]
MTESALLRMIDEGVDVLQLLAELVLVGRGDDAKEVLTLTPDGAAGG